MFSDTRVKGWFLLDNYIPTFVCSAIYLLIVWLGPKYMKNRQPFSCRGILVVYNLGLTLLSLYMFYEVGHSYGVSFTEPCRCGRPELCPYVRKDICLTQENEGQ